MNYALDTLWRAGDGTLVLRRLELVEDVDGQPLGIEVTEGPYVPPATWPWPSDDGTVEP